MKLNKYIHALLVMGLALPCLAEAALNNPNRVKVHPTAVPVGDLTVTGEQIISDDESCAKVVINIVGKVQGVDNDDGLGNDAVEFQLWDDGVIKDSIVLQVPVGVTQDMDLTLSFTGQYLTGAAGVGVYASELNLLLDPFIPTDTTGACTLKPIKGKISNVKSSKMTVTCANKTTGQKVTILDSPSFDCSGAGLIASPKDKVKITIEGVAK